jgi:mannitol operon transcriptional activator
MTRIHVPLTLRQRAIVMAILQAGDRVTHEKLARTTNLSVRVVRYNMSAVRAWFGGQDVKLTSRPGRGVEIDASRAVRRHLSSVLAHVKDRDLALTGVQRRRAFLFELLRSDSPTSFKKLAEKAGSSRSTLIHDADRMQDWLTHFGMRIVRRPKHGISLEGPEHRRRFALLQVLREELGAQRWAQISTTHPETLAEDRTLPGYLRTYLAQLDLPFFGQMMLKIQNNLGRQLTPGSEAGVLVYLAIMVGAVREGNAIREASREEIVGSSEYRVAAILLRDLSLRLSLEIPEPEAVLLAAYLSGSEWQIAYGADGHELRPAEEPGTEALAYSRSIVAACASQLHPLLQIDGELIDGLALHLERAIHRMRHGIPVDSSLAGAVRARYAEVYRSVGYSVGKLEEKLGVVFSDDELALVTMYLAAGLERIGTNRRLARPVIVVTNGSRPKTTLLRSRLGYEFPSLEIVAVTDAARAASGKNPPCELVVSLVPFEHPTHPTIQVSPFLSGDEAKAIRSWLTSKEAQERRQAISQRSRLGIVELLEPANITFLATEIDWRSSVPIAAQPLVDAHKITPGYVQAMIQILEEFGPYMILAPGVILLHAKPSDGVHSLCFGLLVHREGIDFGGSMGRVYAVFVLGAVDNQSHLTALFQLSNLIQKSGFVRTLRQSGNPADVINTIWSFLMTSDSGLQTKQRSEESLQ